MIEISDTQISLNGFPVADITWRPNACATERYLTVDVYDNEGAYEEGLKDGKEKGEELAVESNQEFAADALSELSQKIVGLTDNDLDIKPDQIHEDTATAVFDAILNLINAQKERLSQ